MDWMVEYWCSGYSLRHGGQYEKLQDLTKALCYVTGNNYDQVSTIYSVFNRMKPQLTTNHWYDAGFLNLSF